MRCHRRRSCRSRAIILTEACASLALMGLVLVMVSLLLVQHARATDYFLNHRRVQLAAESSVERMRVHALGIANADFTDDGGVDHEVRVTDSDEAWRPLVCVRVTATVVGRGGRVARYTLSTYLDPGAGSTGDEP